MTDIYTPEFFAEHHQTTALSASVVAPLVKDLLEFKNSALDIGCGQGEWLEAFGFPSSVGVDIAAPEREGFIRHDLTTPFYIAHYYPKWFHYFDLVISLETAEHLPESAADTYVESITRYCAGIGGAVLFSAAVPGQEGLHHVNCQPHEYWHEKFEAHGFEVTDPIRPLIAEDMRVSWWYRQNLFIYR